MDFTPDGLAQQGFSGFICLSTCADSAVPTAGGVYVVLRPVAAHPVFLPISGAGHFKQQDPSVAATELERSWVDGAQVLYIGKAAAGSNDAGGLRRRIRQFHRFGAGEPVGHWGGRYIWQLADHVGLLVAWRVTEAEDPRTVESILIDQFHLRYGCLPFANLRR